MGTNAKSFPWDQRQPVAYKIETFKRLQHPTGRDENGEINCIPFGMPANLEPEQLKEVDQFMQLLSDYAEKCDIDNPSEEPDAKNLDSVTVAEFIAGFNYPDALALVNGITRSLLGVASKEPSALFFLDIFKRATGLKNVISDFKDGAQYLRDRQGNQSFRDRLAAGLKAGSVKVSSAVEAITQKEDETCKAETIDGDVYRAGKVIVSVPTPLYSLIHFEPSLPPATKALGRMWSRLLAEERKRIVLQDIRTAFGTVLDTVSEPINVIEKDWTKDPWAQGGPGPVWRPGFLAGESGKAIAEPFGNIHFVGTETASVWRGYMDGAVRSGIRGGQEVVAQLNFSA
ncbi:Uncharacterized protein LW93_12011 [Fusarium fujikuroi]|nr:Uncharacterized protein LW93_12011 [Fusarium fujikuroi]